MSSISLRQVHKSYDKKQLAVKDMSLEIFDDEFLVLVGPSGCGKTTTLRMIAGLEEITSGKLFINDEFQNDKDPSNRNLSFVFQNYALLPYLTIEENIAFGLINQKLTKLAKKKSVEEIANKLSLFDKLGSYPHQLSGGQRQRVALARALVDGQNLVLFDEPLSNLDAVLRASMRGELIRFKKQYGVTAVYVTHDQVEAMSMATRIVLLMEGKVIQIGTPDQMYNDPTHLEVVTFIGSPETNVISGIFDGKKLVSDMLSFELNEDTKQALKTYVNEMVHFAIRPQDVKVTTSKTPKSMAANLSVVEHFGNNKLLHLDIGGFSIRAVVAADFETKEILYVDLSGHSYLFDKDKRRIKLNQVDQVIFDLKKALDSKEEQVIRELENYGYSLSYDLATQTKNSITVKSIDDNQFEVKTDQQQFSISQLKDLLNHLNYRR